MKKEEIDEFVEDAFKKIDKHFHKAIDNFETEHIRKFRTEIKKLKVFLHLLNMESGDGFSYRINKKLKTIYGYLGIIQNFQLQLKKTNEYVKESTSNIPLCYVVMLEKELEYWKKLSKDFVDADYDFSNDERELIATLPDKLTKKAIKKFIHYTLYELQEMSGHLSDESLDNARKFIEDIHYNYAFIKPFVTPQQTPLFDKKVLGECLELFDNYRDKCMALALLQTLDIDALDAPEKGLVKQMENDWLREKKELKDQLSAKLDSMHIEANNLNAFAFADSLNK
jgi:hypothetical protein